jgi:hypothetical protein
MSSAMRLRPATLLNAVLFLVVCETTAVAIATAAPCPSGSIVTVAKSSPGAATVGSLIDLVDDDDEKAIDDDDGDASLVFDHLPSAAIAAVCDGRPITVASRRPRVAARIAIDTPRAPPYLSHIG